MLGRLGMTVDECIKAYRRVAEQAFTPKQKRLWPSPSSAAFSATQLEAAIKRTVREHCVNAQCMAQRKKGETTVDTCQHEEMLFRDKSCTKTYASREGIILLRNRYLTYLQHRVSDQQGQC